MRSDLQKNQCPSVPFPCLVKNSSFFPFVKYIICCSLVCLLKSKRKSRGLCRLKSNNYCLTFLGAAVLIGQTIPDKNLYQKAWHLLWLVVKRTNLPAGEPNLATQTAETGSITPSLADFSTDNAYDVINQEKDNGHERPVHQAPFLNNRSQ